VRMSPRLRALLALALALSVLLVALPGPTAASSTVVARSTVLATVLTGANEAPGPADPDGRGFALFVLKPATGRVCWAYVVRGVAPITAAHIHRAPPGVPGPVVIPIGASGAHSFSVGCTTADPALVAEIAMNPSAFYFNVHNATYPAGALRGQLHRMRSFHR
jgi:hypothetical protein